MSAINVSITDLMAPEPCISDRDGATCNDLHMTKLRVFTAGNTWSHVQMSQPSMHMQSLYALVLANTSPYGVGE